MRLAKVTISGVSPYSQGRFHDTPKKDKERPDDYEARTWRERLHVNQSTGSVFIPPMAFKNCLSEAAKFISMQVPGKGKSTFTKHFEAGILVAEPLDLNLKPENVDGQWLFIPADGRRGSGKRVKKCFPIIHKWGGEVNFMILDETITNDVFEHHLREAGNFIGVGVFRPRNNGYYGRFKVEKIAWQ